MHNMVFMHAFIYQYSQGKILEDLQPAKHPAYVFDSVWVFFNPLRA